MTENPASHCARTWFCTEFCQQWVYSPVWPRWPTRRKCPGGSGSWAYSRKHYCCFLCLRSGRAVSRSPLTLRRMWRCNFRSRRRKFVSVGYRVVHRSGGGLPIIKLLMTKATDGYLQLAMFGHPTAVDPDFDARHCHSYVSMSEASHLFRSGARGSHYPGCPGPIEYWASERQRIARLRRLPTRWSDDASNKIVYYPVTTRGPTGQRVSGNELFVKNNDVWFHRAVDACSCEGLQTVNGSATV